MHGVGGEAPTAVDTMGSAPRHRLWFQLPLTSEIPLWAPRQQGSGGLAGWGLI